MKQTGYIAEVEKLFADPDTGHIVFLALLAYPSPREIKLFGNFYAAITAERFLAISKSYGIPSSDLILPRFRVEKRKRKRNIENGLQRIKKRMEAAKIALERINFEPSLNKAVENYRYLTDRQHGSDKQVIVNEVWTTTKPVLHMALAILPLFEQWDFLDEPAITLQEMRATMSVSIADLLSHSQRITSKHSITDGNDKFISSAWLPDVIKIANVWKVILPHFTPSF